MRAHLLLALGGGWQVPGRIRWVFEEEVGRAFKVEALGLQVLLRHVGLRAREAAELRHSLIHVEKSKVVSRAWPKSPSQHRLQNCT